MAQTESGNTLQPAPRKRGLGFVVAPLIIFLALAMMFAFSLTSGDPSRLPSVLIGKPAPAFEFASLDGLKKQEQQVPGFSQADLAIGEPVVVNFWASWCVPCIAEHPHLIALGEKTGVKMFGVNYKDDPAAARRFMGRYGNPFASVGVDPTGRGAIEWGVYGMPETFVLNGKGEIVYKHVGPITEQSLRDAVIPAVEKARPGAPGVPAQG